jgi:formate hydrogenlyase subunit 6/NADH:ubiquinone oxidoreductase subunit I
VIRAARCTKCGTCVAICPVVPKAVDFRNASRSSPPVHSYDRCIRCYCCQEICPESAIEIAVPFFGRLIHRAR